MERLAEIMTNAEMRVECIQLNEHTYQENRYFTLEEHDYIWLIEQAEKTLKG